MNKKDALGILGTRTPIASVGKYTVKVTNCGDYLKALPNGRSVIAIANFSAMTPYQIEQAKGQIHAGEFDKALNNNLSLSIRDNDYRPSKGEMVDIEVGLVPVKDSETNEMALLVTSLTPRKATIVTAKCDFSEFLDEAEVVETSTASATTLED
jgi:hypothetical protein